MKKIASAILVLLTLFFGVENLSDFNFDEFGIETEETSQLTSIQEDESYDSLQDVVDYLYLFDELPSNYLTKKEAQALGWEASEGNLWELAPDMSIGGDYFGNFEGRLPEEKGRNYQEADINYEGGYRGPERLVFSNDGLYFYTENHYESFTEVEPSGDLK